MALVSSVSSSPGFNTSVLKSCRTSFTEETLTCASPERASVNSTRGLWALWMDSKNLMSCHKRARCLVFLSAENIFEMAFSSFGTRAIIAWQEPHLVGDSVINWCLGRENSCCAVASPFSFSRRMRMLQPPFCTHPWLSLSFFFSLCRCKIGHYYLKSLFVL